MRALVAVALAASEMLENETTVTRDVSKRRWGNGPAPGKPLARELYNLSH